MDYKEKSIILAATAFTGAITAPLPVEASASPELDELGLSPQWEYLPVEASALAELDEFGIPTKWSYLPSEQERTEENINYFRFDLTLLTTSKLESVEKLRDGYVVNVLTPTPLYLVPYTDEKNKWDIRVHDLDTEGEIKQRIANEGMTFEIEQKRVLVSRDGTELELGVLANTYGSKFVASILLGVKKGNRKISFVERNFAAKNSITYLVTGTDVYPNKVKNILIGLMKISEYQEENGPLVPGEMYSLLTMTGVNDWEQLQEYEKGRTGAGGIVFAGGVCATVTGISSLLHEMEGFYVNRVPHGAHYSQGPHSPDPNRVDATILYNGPTNSTDMTFSLKKNQAPGHLHFAYQLMPSGVPFNETDPNGVTGLSDIHLIVTYSFEQDKPISQIVDLHAGTLYWDNFRKSAHKEKLPYQELLKSKDYSLDNLKMLDLAKNIYPGNK